MGMHKVILFEYEGTKTCSIYISKINELSCLLAYYKVDFHMKYVFVASHSPPSFEH